MRSDAHKEQYDKNYKNYQPLELPRTLTGEMNQRQIGYFNADVPTPKNDEGEDSCHYQYYKRNHWRLNKCSLANHHTRFCCITRLFVEV